MNPYGKAPFGYRRDGPDLVPSEEEQQALAIVAESVEAGWPLRKIASRLNGAGVPPRHSKVWRVSTLAKIVKRLKIESAKI